MDQLFIYDPTAAGVKGLVFIGDKILVYRRDNNTTKWPLKIDVPGGGTEDKETPYETFARELHEEFDLTITQEQVSYCRKYKAADNVDKNGYFVVVKLSAITEEQIKFGDEGLEYMLMPLDEYLAHPEGIPAFQARAQDYLDSFNQK